MTDVTDQHRAAFDEVRQRNQETYEQQRDELIAAVLAVDRDLRLAHDEQTWRVASEEVRSEVERLRAQVDLDSNYIRQLRAQSAVDIRVHRMEIENRKREIEERGK